MISCVTTVVEMVGSLPKHCTAVNVTYFIELVFLNLFIFYMLIKFVWCLVIVVVDKAEELVVDKVDTVDTTVSEEQEVEEELKKEEEEAISSKELEEIEEVLEQVAEERMSMKLEQEELQTLKSDVEDYQEVGMVVGEIVWR